MFRALLILLVLILPAVALGQTSGADFVPLTNLPGIDEVAGEPDLSPFLNQLYRLLIGAAAVIAVIQIMRAGIKFMTNKGSVSENQEAKQLIQMSVVGLVLILSPVIVFSIINPKILNLEIDTGSLRTSIGDISVEEPVDEDPRLCEDRESFQWTQVPSGGTCNDVLTGGGWINAPMSCGCEAPQPEGATCCAKNTNYRPPPPTPGDEGTFSFLTYVAYTERNADGSSYPTCLARNERTFTSRTACDAGFNSAIDFMTTNTSGQYGQFVVARRCDTEDQTSEVYTPQSVWQVISTHPSCGF